METISEQWLRKHFPAETNTQATIEEWRFRCGPRREIILKTRCQWSVESQPVKRTLGGWCEIVARLGHS
jgi:hypothetical protein